jgi:hypothetical protein
MAALVLVTWLLKSEYALPVAIYKYNNYHSTLKQYLKALAKTGAHCMEQ